MNPRLVFFLVCIPTRLALAILAWKRQDLLEYMAPFALAISLGFSAIYLRIFPRDTGIETRGKPIWWNELRLFHSATYMSFAMAAHMKKNYAYKILLLDVAVGALAGVWNWKR